VRHGCLRKVESSGKYSSRHQKRWRIANDIPTLTGSLRPPEVQRSAPPSVEKAFLYACLKQMGKFHGPAEKKALSFRIVQTVSEFRHQHVSECRKRAHAGMAPKVTVLLTD